jgi:hypothetical protein
MTNTVARPRSRPSPASVPATSARPADAAPAVDQRIATIDSAGDGKRPTMVELWQQAEGDSDRYLGLLRDHGYARPRATLEAILFDVVAIAAHQVGLAGFDEATCDDVAGAMTPLLVDELGKHGYRIHDVARCIRPPVEELGRPMTDEEQATLLPTAKPIADTPDLIEFITPEGDRFLVPHGYTPGDKSSRCRSCDALICWCLTRNQKRAPMNPDGTSHFASCPDAPAWRKRDA